MLRKRLLGLLATMLLALNAAPAAAMTTADTAFGDTVVVTSMEVAKGAATLADLTSAAANLGPEVDEEIPGVGGVLVDIDEENMSLTVGLRLDAAGIDESVTLGGSSAGSDEEAESDHVSDDAPSPAEQAATADKAAMDDAKAAAAAQAAANRGPAFTAGREAARSASGNASAGTGVASSTRPTISAPDLDVPTAATGFAEDGSSPWLRLMGTLMLAGTGTAWSLAKRHGLA